MGRKIDEAIQTVLGSGRRRNVVLWLVLVGGLIGRMILLPLTWHSYDMMVFRSWMYELVVNGPDHFYSAELVGTQDHLPGDITLIWALGELLNIIKVPLVEMSISLVISVKLVAFAFELLIAKVVHSFLSFSRREAGAAIVIAAVTLNPGIIMISAVWGQWDVISAAVAMYSLFFSVKGRPIIALGLLSLSSIIKPQMLLLVPFIVVYLARTASTKDIRARCELILLLRKLTVGALLSVCIVSIVGFPYGVGLIRWGPIEWSYLERVGVAHDMYPYTTLGAYNLWIIPIGFGAPPVDTSDLAFGVSYLLMGYILFSLFYICSVLFSVYHPRIIEGMTMGATIAFMSQFLFLTREHERYLLPAILFSYLLWSANRRYLWLLVGLSATLFLDVYLSFVRDWNNFLRMGALQQDWMVRMIAIVNLGLLGVVIWSYFTADDEDRQEPIEA